MKSREQMWFKAAADILQGTKIQTDPTTPSKVKENKISDLSLVQPGPGKYCLT